MYKRELPPSHHRQTLWGDGEWDATWYCLACWAEYWGLQSIEEVKDKLGWTKRAETRLKVARLAKQKQQRQPQHSAEEDAVVSAA
jgi:hypothetical protein